MYVDSTMICMMWMYWHHVYCRYIFYCAVDTYFIVTKCIFVSKLKKLIAAHYITMHSMTDSTP